MPEDGVYIVGAGGHAKVVISTLQAAGFTVRGLLDGDERKWGASLLGVPVLGPEECLEALPEARAVIGVGHNGARKAIAERLGGGVQWVTVIHPMAWVHPSVQLGQGTVVFAGAVIQPEVKVGDHVIINTAATADHDCRLGNYAQLAPGVHLAGNVRVGEGVMMGIGSTAIQGTVVGSWTTVGAGAVVVRDLPGGVTAVGVPARVIKEGQRR